VGGWERGRESEWVGFREGGRVSGWVGESVCLGRVERAREREREGEKETVLGEDEGDGVSGPKS
jgi:hypothetical protein